MKNSAAPAIFNVTGKILGPTYEVDVDSLNFGIVPFGFPSRKNFKLQNTSEIPMDFKLRIPSTNSEGTSEFLLEPSSGNIPPFSNQNIKVEWTPVTQGHLSTKLLVDVACVGEGVISIPVLAECCVPLIKLSSSSLDFNNVFLHHIYEKTLVFQNDTDLPACYELVPQDESQKAVAEYEVDQPEGQINAYSKKVVKILFKAKKLRHINIPIYFRIKGSTQPPLELILYAISQGPAVNIEPKKDVINFGRVPGKIIIHAPPY